MAVDIPGYKIEGILGKGSMGMVYKALQLSMNRVVAVKVLSEELAEDEQFTKRFIDEARSMGKLRHENLVSAIDAGSSNGVYYFIMDYVDGKTVDTILREKSRLDVSEAFRIAEQIADALDYAHSKGIVHRDVKPGNIIIDRNGIAKLCDMGLARPKGGVLSESERGRAEGTPFYISPEQARGEADVDHRSDIYSLGATLYHLVTGRPPYQGGGVKETMRMHIEEELTPVRAVAPDVDERFAKIIEKMLEKEREKRYQSAKEVADDIAAVLEGKEPTLGRRPSVLELIHNKYFPPIVILAAGLITFIILVATGDRKASTTPAEKKKPRTTPTVSHKEKTPSVTDKEREKEEKLKETMLSLKHDLEKAVTEAEGLANLKIKLEALLAKYRGSGLENIITEEIKSVEERLRAQEALERQTKIAQKAIEESEELLDGNNYLSAWLIISAVKAPEPLIKRKTSLMKRIEASNQKEVTELAVMVETMLKNAEFTEALRATENLLRRSLDRFVPLLKKLRDRIIAAETDWKNKKRYENFAEEFKAKLSAGKYEEARDTANRALKECDKRYEKRIKIALFMAEATLRTIIRLRESFKTALGRRVTYKLYNGETISGKVVAVTDDGVVFKQGGLHRSISLTELDTTDLLRILSKVDGTILYESGIYLMVIGRPDRALHFFKEARRLGIKVNPDWLREAQEAYERVVDTQARNAVAQLEAWLKKNKPEIAAELLKQILNDNRLKNTDFIKRNLSFIRKKIKRMLIEKMRAEGLKSLLYGKVKWSKDGLVKIEYRFSDAEEFLDWMVDKRQKSYIQKIKGDTLVRGTIYHKVVFDGDVEVEVRCVPLNKKSANIGVLLKATTDGAYLFGLQHRLAGDERGLSVHNGYVRLPANIIVRYHRNWKERNGLFGCHLPKATVGSLYKVGVSHKGNKLKFVVNRKKLAELKENFPRDSRGVVGLFAGDGTFRVTFIRIEGEVDEEWLQEAIEAEVIKKYPHLAEK